VRKEKMVARRREETRKGISSSVEGDCGEVEFEGRQMMIVMQQYLVGWDGGLWTASTSYTTG